MAKKLSQNARGLYLSGTPGLEHAIDRRKGFNDALKQGGRSDVVIQDDKPGNYSRSLGMEITEQ